MNNNYLKMQSFSPFSVIYIFVDTIDHIYERIMEKNGIILTRVKEYVKSDSSFRLISCRIKKRDELMFCNVIKQIRNIALLQGYRDYDDMCFLMQKCESDLLNKM